MICKWKILSPIDSFINNSSSLTRSPTVRPKLQYCKYSRSLESIRDARVADQMAASHVTYNTSFVLFKFPKCIIT